MREYINANQIIDLMVLADSINNETISNAPVTQGAIYDNTINIITNYLKENTTLQEHFQDCIDCIIESTIYRTTIKDLIKTLEYNEIYIAENMIKAHYYVTVRDENGIITEQENGNISTTKQNMREYTWQIGMRYRYHYMPYGLSMTFTFSRIVNHNEKKFIVKNGKINDSELEEFLKN